MTVRIAPCYMLALFTVPMTFFLVPPTQSRRSIVLPSALSSEKAVERIAAYNQIISRHRLREQELMEIGCKAKTSYKYSDTRALAIDLLALTPSREAVAMLVEQIEYKQPSIVTEVTPLNGYPSAMSLRTIGQSSVPVIFAHLQLHRQAGVSEKAIDLYAKVLCEIYGPNEGGSQEAIRVVERAHNRAAQKENLARLIARMRAVANPDANKRAPTQCYLRPLVRPPDLALLRDRGKVSDQVSGTDIFNS